MSDPRCFYCGRPAGKCGHIEYKGDGHYILNNEDFDKLVDEIFADDILYEETINYIKKGD